LAERGTTQKEQEHQIFSSKKKVELLDRLIWRTVERLLHLGCEWLSGPAERDTVQNVMRKLAEGYIRPVRRYAHA